MTQVIAPNLGQSGMDVLIETWHVADGDMAEKGKPLYELSNEKLTQEVEAPASGKLKILVAEGETASPGTPIAEIE